MRPSWSTRRAGSWQHVFHDPATLKAAIVGPVWSYDPLSGPTATRSAEEILTYERGAGLEVV